MPEIDWKAIDEDLRDLATGFEDMLVFTHENPKKGISIHHYHCNKVEELVSLLEDKTKAFRIAATHDVLGILFSHFKYPKQSVLEYPTPGGRVDLFLKVLEKKVEIKTVIHMTIKKIQDKARLVLSEESRRDTDWLWIFYFQKIHREQKEYPSEEDLDGTTCKYLLSLVDINLLGITPETLNEDLKQMVESSKKGLARKLDEPLEIILPLENLVRVDALEEKVKEKEKALEEKDKALEKIEEARKQDKKALEEKDKALEKIEEARKQDKKALEEKDKLISEQKKLIERLEKQ